MAKILDQFNVKSNRKMLGAALFWVLFIYASSSGVITIKQLTNAVASLSGGAISETSFLDVWLKIWWFVVKGWHCIEFGILFLLLRFVLKKDLLAAGLALFFGFLDEYHQLFVADRGGRITDVLIDALGILIFWYFARRKELTKDSVVKLTPFFRPMSIVALFTVWLICLGYLSLNPSPELPLGPANADQKTRFHP